MPYVWKTTTANGGVYWYRIDTATGNPCNDTAAANPQRTTVTIVFWDEVDDF